MLGKFLSRTCLQFDCENIKLVMSFMPFMAGCAFLKYETKEQALAAMDAVNGKHKMEVCLSHVPISINTLSVFFCPN